MPAASFPVIRIETSPARNRGCLQTCELFYVLSGAITLTVENISYPVHENELFYLSSGLTYSMDSGSETVLSRLSFSPGRDNDILDGTCFKLQRTNTFGQLCISSFLNMVMHYQVVREFDDYCLSSYYQLLYSLRTYLQTTGAAHAYSSVHPDDVRARSIGEFLESHYSEPVTQTDVARHFHLSASYLSRYFRKQFHTTMVDYLTGIRLSHIVSDLASTDRSITEIALSHGFSNISTFNSAFRRTYHISPSDYRKSARSDSVRTDNLLLHSIENNTPRHQASDSVQIDIRNAVRYGRPWSRIINAGPLSDLNDYQVREELANACRDLDIHTVRVWNILTPENGMTRYISDEISDYDFTGLDKALDLLVNNSLVPFIDFSFSGTDDRPGAEPESQAFLTGFGSVEDTDAAFRVMLRHIIRRYGREKVSEWVFGMWLPGEDDRFDFIPEFLKEDGVFPLVEAFYHTIRQTVPQARIALAEFGHLYKSGSIRNELKMLKGAGIQPDIITCTSYPYVLSDAASLPSAKRFAWTLTPHFIMMELANIKALLDEADWKDIPVWLISYNLNTWLKNILNDSRFRGSYILENMADIYDMTDAAAISLLCDSSVTPGVNGSQMCGNAGIITYSGIKKPAYYALSFLSEAKGLIAARGRHYLATTDGNNSCHLLLFNSKEPGLAAFMEPESSLRADRLSSYFNDNEPLAFSAEIGGFKPGSYKISIRAVTESSGDLQSWLLNNYTEDGLLESEISWLKNTVRPSMQLQKAEAGADGILRFSYSLGPNDFCSVSITPLDQ